MLNHVTLMGRLTKDPELRYTASETPVATFTVACDRGFSKNETDFINCVSWRKTAEFISKYFRKGSMIAISGRLQVRSWKTEEGNTRSMTEVVVENAYFGESKKTDVVSNFSEIDDDDGELPF